MVVGFFGLCNLQSSIVAQIEEINFNGTTALLFKPDAVSIQHQSPLIVALHGLDQTLDYTMDKYLQFAKDNNSFVLCPQGNSTENGYTRFPVDDRVVFKELTEKCIAEYPINPKKVVLSGFSRGGNLAIEMGILYPKTFPKVLAMFCYFNDVIEGQDLIEYASIKSVQGAYRNFNIWFVTGKDDLSEKEMNRTYRFFHEILVNPHLFTFPNLTHMYPPNIDRILTLLINKET